MQEERKEEPSKQQAESLGHDGLSENTPDSASPKDWSLLDFPVSTSETLEPRNMHLKSALVHDYTNFLSYAPGYVHLGKSQIQHHSDSLNHEHRSGSSR
jgi:hypothetical protein